MSPERLEGAPHRLYTHTPIATTMATMTTTRITIPALEGPELPLFLLAGGEGAAVEGADVVIFIVGTIVVSGAPVVVELAAVSGAPVVVKLAAESGAPVVVGSVVETSAVGSSVAEALKACDESRMHKTTSAVFIPLDWRNRGKEREKSEKNSLPNYL